MSQQTQNTGASFPLQSPLPASLADANPDSVSGRALGGRAAFDVSRQARRVGRDAMAPGGGMPLAPLGDYGAV